MVSVELLMLIYAFKRELYVLNLSVWNTVFVDGVGKGVKTSKYVIIYI